MKVGDILKLIDGYKDNFRIATGHELSCYWVEGRNYELEELANMIKDFSGVDVKEKRRIPKIVRSKAIFCIIAREMRYSTTELGKFLNMDHTSVVHHTKTKHKDSLFNGELYRFREYFNNPSVKK